MKKLFNFLIPALALLTLSACNDDAPDEQVVQPIQQAQVQQVVVQQPSYTMAQVDNYYNTCLMTNGIEQDDFCEEICSVKFDANSCDTVEDKYELIFAALQKPSYTLVDVEYNYKSCLFREGFDQDDYCEEACSFEFDANSCDIIEDRYELLYGIGADKSKHNKLVRVRVKTESAWKDRGYTYSCSAWTPSTSSKSSFKQTASCKQKQVRTVTYTDGYKAKDYQVITVRKERQYTATTAKYATKKVSVVQKNSVKADRYSSNLSRTSTKTSDTKVVNKTHVATKVEPQKNVKAERYSSNLVRTSDKTSRTEDKSVTNTSPPVTETVSNETIAVAAVATTAVGVKATRYSSNLKSTKSKTDEKAKALKAKADAEKKAKEEAQKRATKLAAEKKAKVDAEKKAKAKREKAKRDKAKREAKKREKARKAAAKNKKKR